MNSDNIDQYKNVLSNKIAEISNIESSTLAQIRLDQYIDAEKAYSNILASAASSYSDVRGTISKRAVDEARESRDRAWDALADIMAKEGVDFINFDNAVSNWDLSGN